MGRGKMVIVETAHIFYMKNLENVVHAGHCLEVRAAGIHHIGAFGKIHQQRTAGILCQGGIVLRGERSPQTFHADEFAPLQFSKQRNAVENLPVHIPAQVETGVTVVEEFHVVHQAERTLLFDVREIGGRHDEQRKGHAVPLGAGIEADIDFPPTAHPETFVESHLGEIIAIVAAEKTFDAERVREGEDGGIEIDGQTSLLGVDIGATGGEFHLKMHLSGANLPVVEQTADVGSRRNERRNGIAQRLEEEGSGGFILLGFQAQDGFEPPVFLAFEGELLPIVKHHLVYLGPLQSGEDVIFVGAHKLVGGRHHVVGGREGERATRKLAR